VDACDDAQSSASTYRSRQSVVRKHLRACSSVLSGQNRFASSKRE
jgi:hypothetical protein